jgi:hypothetical protein
MKSNRAPNPREDEDMAKRIPVIKIVRERTVAYQSETKTISTADQAADIIREVMP